MRALWAIVIIIVLLLSTFVRLYRLSSVPHGFHADEAAFGYNAYSLLKTGKDEYGVSFPLTLKSFGDYKGAVYSYLTVPAVAAFGLTEFAVRLPTALAGIGIVVVSFMLALALTKNAALALVGAIIVSFAPSSIVLSRVQSDPLAAVFFMLCGWAGLHRYIHTNRFRWAVLTILFWCISLFTYASARVLLLGFIPLLFWYYFPQLTKATKAIGIAIYACIVILILYLLAGSTGTRFDQVSVFSSQEVALPLAEQIREDGVVQTPVWLARIHHNKIVDYGRYIIHNYSDYFSFDFLFFQAYQPEREKIPNTGVMHLIELPFLLVGLYQILKTKKRWGYFILGWFLFTPFALSIFGAETPNIHRYYFSIFPASLIVGLGIVTSVACVKKNMRTLAIIVVAMAYLVNVEYFFHELFVHQPLHLPQYRGFAYKDMVQQAEQMKGKYDKVVVTKSHQSPYAYVLFFSQYDPARYQLEGSPRDLDHAGFDKYIFVPLDCPSIKRGDTTDVHYPGERVLYINYGGCKTESFANELQSIYWADGTKAFQFIENIDRE